MNKDLNNIKTEDDIKFERGDDGMILPTLRNQDFFNDLLKKYGSRKALPEALKNDFNLFLVQQTAFSEGIIDAYSTPEAAMNAFARKNKTSELDKKYLEEKGK